MSIHRHNEVPMKTLESKVSSSVIDAPFTEEECSMIYAARVKSHFKLHQEAVNRRHFSSDEVLITLNHYYTAIKDYVNWCDERSCKPQF